MEKKPEFEINTLHLFNEVLHLDTVISKEAYSEILQQYETLVTRKNASYQKDIEIEYYDPKRHFYFVEKFENYYNPKQSRTTKDDMILGYICRDHSFPKIDKEESSLFEIDFSYPPGWEEEIKITLANELPERLKKFNGNHTLNNPRIESDDIAEAFRWMYDVIHFRHSNITLINNENDYWDKTLFQYFFSLQLSITEFDNLYDFLDYHLKLNFQNDLEKFVLELEVIFAKFEDRFLKLKTINFVQKWIEKRKSPLFNLETKLNSPEREVKLIHPIFTKAQWVLIFYYFLQYFGIEPRKNIDITEFAKFIHLFTGVKLPKKISNSDIYKMSKVVPNIKIDKQLLMNALKFYSLI